MGGINWSKLFRHYDRDNSGGLDYDEFHRAVRKDAKLTVSILPDSDLRWLFRQVDVDGGGSVDLAEFAEWLSAESSNRLGSNNDVPSSSSAKYRRERERESGAGRAGRAATAAAAKKEIVRNGSDHHHHPSSSKKSSSKRSNKAAMYFPSQQSHHRHKSHTRKNMQYAQNSTPSSTRHQMTPVREKDIRSRLHVVSHNVGGLNWKKIFRSYDLDDNGVLDATEFNAVLRKSANIGKSVLPDSDIARIFHHVDVDQSGYIDVEEFVQWLRRGRLAVMAVDDGEYKDDGKIAFGQSTFGKSARRIPPRQLLQQRAMEMKEEDESARWQDRKRAHPKEPKEPKERGNDDIDFDIRSSSRLEKKPPSVSSSYMYSSSSSSLSTTSRFNQPAEYEQSLSEYSGLEDSGIELSGAEYTEEGQEQASYEAEAERRVTLYNDELNRQKRKKIYPTVTWPTAKMSDSKRKLLNTAREYANNQRKLLETLAESSDEIIALGTHAMEVDQNIIDAQSRLYTIRTSALAVIHASSNRRHLAKLLRVWHSWFLRQRAKRTTFRIERYSTLVRCWSMWCRYLLRAKLKALKHQHHFLTSLQDRHALAASHRTMLRAVELVYERLPLRRAMRRWSVFTILRRALPPSTVLESSQYR